MVGGGSAEVDAVLVLPHHVQQLPEPQHPHAVCVAAVDCRGQMAQSDETVARHEGIVASLEERRRSLLLEYFASQFSLTSWGTDLEE